MLIRSLSFFGEPLSAGMGWISRLWFRLVIKMIRLALGCAGTAKPVDLEAALGELGQPSLEI